MIINLARSAGFCFGVKRALKIALEAASQKKDVCMLGDIVHNEDVVRTIRQAGIHKISRLGKGKGKILLLRAHGASRKILQQAKRLGFTILDATCPMVKEIHSIATSMEKKGYQIIVVGDENHDEVKGIVGQLQKKYLVIDPIHLPSTQQLRRIKKACVVVQSTQNIKIVLEICSLLKKNIAELKFFNTICRPTRMKQEEIQKMPLENDIMVIIGSKTSANTKRLYEISKRLNTKTYWVENASALKNIWFQGVEKVGITAGASTPETTTLAVIQKMKQIAR